MDAEFSVELGPPSEDATLEFPWTSGVSGGPRYLDLKQHPELLAQVEEAVRYPELTAFLKAANSRRSLFETAKCDAWYDEEVDEADAIYDGDGRFGCYVDLAFDRAAADSRFSFFRHEDVGRALVTLLKKAPDIPASVEVIVRRCFYRDAAETREGFYFTLYVFGYGQDEAEARRRWRVALDLAGNAILQLSLSER
ncbi:MAG: hypothetical protein ACE14L_16190 [Terriglobales bacterium]